MNCNELKTKVEQTCSNRDILCILNELSENIKDLEILIEESKQIEIKDSKTLQIIKSQNYIKIIIDLIENFCRNDQRNQAQSLLKDILMTKGNNIGKFYELMVYYWLFKENLRFVPQVHIKKEDCYKNNDNGYDADGMIKEFNCIFDVKEFGIVFSRVETLKEKIQDAVNKKFNRRIKDYMDEINKLIKAENEKLNNEKDINTKLNIENIIKSLNKNLKYISYQKDNGLWEYTVKIEGICNIDMKDLQLNGFERITDIADDLIKAEWNSRIEYLECGNKWNNDNDVVRDEEVVKTLKLEKAGLRVALYSPINSGQKNRYITSVFECNAYEWAEKNEFYFIKDASQFVRNKPYFVICAFNKNTDILFMNNENNYDIFFRPLSRRMFIHLNNMKDRNIDSFDGKAVRGVSIAELSRKLTGIIFIEISELEDLNNRHTPLLVYLNPNADNKLYDHQIELFYLLKAQCLEKFEYDNY